MIGYWKIANRLYSPFLIAISVSFCLHSHARELVDATQAKVILTDRPQRIVTLAPSLSELAADFVGDELGRIVGVSEFSDYPPKLKSFPSVGPYHQFNLEKVVSLKPDLVLATTDGNPKDKILHLRELGVPVVTVNTETFGDIQESMRTVSMALGVPEYGIRMAAKLKAGIERMRDVARSRSKLKVLLQLGEQPLIVAGKNSFLNAAVELIGAKNIYSDSESHYPRPALEDVLSRNPDVIVVVALGEDNKAFQEMAQKWMQFRNMNAVKNHRVTVLRSDTLLRPTLRLLEGLSLLSQGIYGKR